MYHHTWLALSTMLSLLAVVTTSSSFKKSSDNVWCCLWAGLTQPNSTRDIFQSVMCLWVKSRHHNGCAIILCMLWQIPQSGEKFHFGVLCFVLYHHRSFELLLKVLLHLLNKELKGQKVNQQNR